MNSITIGLNVKFVGYHSITAAPHVNPAGNHTASHYSAPPPVSFPADASSHQTFFTRAMPALVNPRHNRLVRATTLLLLAFLVVLILFYLTGKYA